LRIIGYPKIIIMSKLLVLQQRLRENGEEADCPIDFKFICVIAYSPMKEVSKGVVLLKRMRFSNYL